MPNTLSVAAPRIYFHHIGKTAGTSFRSYLVTQVGEANVSPMLRGLKYRDALREYARFQVIAGHIEPLPGDTLPSDRISVTLLRDPVDRYISEFFFLRNVHDLHVAATTGGSRALEEWLDSAPDESESRANAHVHALWAFGWHERSIPDPECMLAAAKRALDAFDVIGLQHRLPESIAAFAKCVGWIPPAKFPTENSTPGRIEVSDLPERALKRLRRMLEPDYDLYHHALKRFDRQASKSHGAPAQREILPPSSVRLPDGDAAEPACLVASSPSKEQGGGASIRRGSGEIVVTGVKVSGHVSEANGRLRVGEWTTIEVRFHSTIHEPNLSVGIALHDHHDALVFGTNTHVLGDNLAVTPGDFAVSFRFLNNLGLGVYSVASGLSRAGSDLEKCFDRFEKATVFEIIDRLGVYFEGRVRLDVATTVTALSDQAIVEATPTNVDQSAVSIIGQRNAALTDFAAELSSSTPIPPLKRASDATVAVTVRNTGKSVWPGFGRRSVRIAYHWLDCEGRLLEYEGLRTMLPRDISPGESLAIPCFLRVPEIAGDFILVWTLVQEGVAWFDEKRPDACLQCGVQVI